MNKPNVLIIYTDQLSRNMLGCYGGSEVTTPNIDSLAQNGYIFNNFFTPSAVCTPSRAMFMTGNYPHINGAYKNHMSVGEEQKGFANYFAKNGYRTGYVGKWHLSAYSTQKNIEFDSFNNLGFNDFLYRGEFGHAKKVEEINGNLQLSKENGDGKSYTTDWLADKTLQYISCTQTPFLFMVSIPDPHQPYRVRPPYDTMYAPENVVVPNSFYQTKLPDWAEDDRWGRNIYYPIDNHNREADFRKTKAQYLGEIKCIDDNVGKIITHLKDSGQYDNTIIIFTTDHGDYMGEHGLMEKNNLYDSVYRLPLIIKPVEEIVGGKTINNFVNVVDFPKTICDLVGVDNSAMICNGKSRISDIYNSDFRDDEEIYLHPSDVPRAGIITREYELAYVGKAFSDDRIFKEHILFDRTNDEEQLINLYNKPEYADLINTLTQKIKNHHKSLKTPMSHLPQEVWYE